MIETKPEETKPEETDIIDVLQYNDIDTIMDREKQKNKGDIWSKIDKSLKIQKLHAFAEKYGKEHNHSMKEIKTLKTFFTTALENGKLQKTKDVVYDKEKKEISHVPALTNTLNDKRESHFTLKNLDLKRVSTIKSLTPRRHPISIKKDTDGNVEKN
jgi:hypothetical protein